jgi:alcohol dehydrogenase class IV
MVHAIEAFTCINPNRNTVSQALAREALRLLSANIRRAVTCGEDLEARGAMLLGSMLAGQAFANSPVGAVHALAYPLGTLFHLPHGLTNSLVLPQVLRFNARNETTASEYAALAPEVFPRLAASQAAQRLEPFIDGLHSLAGELGLPTRLRDAQVPRDAVPKLAAESMKQTRLLVNNPRALSEADALAIYESVW